MAQQELSPLKQELNDASDDNEEKEEVSNKANDQAVNMEIVTSSVKRISCCDRLRLLTHPISSKEVVMKNGDAETQMIIVPEAFRMLFYFGFIVFSFIAFLVTSNFSELDVEDNPILNRFGNNNICIFYDFPPFTYFGTSLWVINVIMLLLYEYFDLFRVYDAYMDGEIGKLFYYIYRASTIFECASIIFFTQITATSPFESMYFHAGPFIIFTYGLWAMAFKKFIYFTKIGVFEDYPGYVHVLGYVYLCLYLLIVLFKTWINVSNLFEAYLWKQPGLEWTALAATINDRLFLVMVLVCPMITYFVLIGDSDIQSVTHIVNRKKRKIN